MSKPAKLIGRLLPPCLKYLTAALLIFIPLYPKFPLFFLPKSTVAVRVEDFLFLLSFFCLSLHYLFNFKALLKAPLFKQISIYLFIGLVSVVSAILITKSVDPKVAILHLFRRLEYMFGFFLIYEVVKQNPKNFAFFTKIIILCSFFVLIYGIAQIFFGAPIVSTMNEEFSKGYTLILQPGVPISSTFAGHYDLAIYLVFILSIIANSISTLKQKILRLSLFLLLIGEVWLLEQTGLRTAAFTGFVCTVIIFLYYHKFRYALIFSLIFIIGALNTPRLVGRFGNLLRVVKFSEITTPAYAATPTVSAAASREGVTPTPPPEALRPVQQDRSTSIRLDVEWPRAWRAFLKNPFLGTGYSSITLATDDDYFRAIGETGILGLLSFLSICIALVRQSFKKLNTPVFFAIVMGMLISAVFIDVFEASKVASFFWLLMGLNYAQKS